ncbi:MAG: hypothetical protein D6729_18965 [Deltaproteobacteria bacterium]|nr:MAG: hypothetical protein D6729_18965 [Deltaproteobacteria bacterium]
MASDARPKQRSSPRRAVSTEFRLGEEWGVGEIVLDSADLSAGGVFLKADLLFEPEEEIELQFTLPASERVIRALGRVVRTQHGGEGRPSGMGIQFVRLDEADRKALTEFLGGAE